MLELRFPDTSFGWEQWQRLVEGVRKNEKAFTINIEEIEPGKMKAVISLE